MSKPIRIQKHTDGIGQACRPASSLQELNAAYEQGIRDGRELGVAEERARILKGLPEEMPTPVLKTNDPMYPVYIDGWNKCRQQVLALLEGNI